MLGEPRAKYTGPVNSLPFFGVPDSMREWRERKAGTSARQRLCTLYVRHYWLHRS